MVNKKGKQFCAIWRAIKINSFVNYGAKYFGAILLFNTCEQLFVHYRVQHLVKYCAYWMLSITPIKAYLEHFCTQYWNNSACRCWASGPCKTWETLGKPGKTWGNLQTCDSVTFAKSLSSWLDPSMAWRVKLACYLHRASRRASWSIDLCPWPGHGRQATELPRPPGRVAALPLPSGRWAAYHWGREFHRFGWSSDELDLTSSHLNLKLMQAAGFIMSSSSGILGHSYLAPKIDISHLGYIAPS